MEHFKLWIKSKHELNSLNDDEYKQIEPDLLKYFGGTRNLINIILKDKYNLNYVQLNELSEIIENYKYNNNKQQSSDKNSTINLLSISNNSLSKICEFLTKKDAFNLQSVNTLLL